MFIDDDLILVPESERPVRRKRNVDWTDFQAVVVVECAAFRAELTQELRCRACSRSLCDYQTPHKEEM